MVSRHIISLGAGVQSSTMALMAKHGEITPMPDCAIFADTQAEPKNVYDWLDYLEKQLPFPVHRVTAGNLEEASLLVTTSKNGNKYKKHNIPAFILQPDGQKGIMQRHCTVDFKITPIKREIRRLAGSGWRRANITQWIGISYDEVERMKPSRVSYIKHIWPLIDKKMTRNDCLKWMLEHGYPKPPRSACYFCPFHSSGEWDALSDENKAKSAEYEVRLQASIKRVDKMSGVPYLHSSCKPIGEFFQRPIEPDLFDDQFKNECEGHCGV